MDRLTPLLAELGLDLDAGAAAITGADPVLPSRYPLGESAAAVLAAIGLASRALRGADHPVAVDARHAGALLRGFYDQVVDGEVLDPDPTSKLAGVGLFATRDDRLVQTYGVFEPLLGRLLEVLECDEDAVAGAIGGWEAEPLVEALNAAGTPGAVLRTGADWDVHPQGRALAALPVVCVERIGDAAPEAAPAPRVLDLTRIIAGPTCGRTLAEQGARVLAVEAPGLPIVHRALVDTAPGKQRITLDLDRERVRLEALIGRSDVFLSSAAPGSFARRGLAAEDLAALRPGIVVATTDAYGHVGPWADRRGFEPLAQASTGWVDDHGGEIVGALPCDYVTGFLSALGVLTALLRRREEGGSWHVRTSLCRTAVWLRDQPGRYDPSAAMDLSPAATADLRVRRDTPFGVTEPLRAPAVAW